MQTAAVDPVTRLTRHIVVVLQILALVAYPQMVGAAGFSRAASAETMSDAAQSHLDNDTEYQLGHHHDSAMADHPHSDKPDGFASGQDEGGLACHPCCIGGKGPCMAVVMALPDVVRPGPVRVFNSSPLSTSYSVQVAPLPHPPKAHI